ncbi:site-specific integrase [Roseburia hominis]
MMKITNYAIQIEDYLENLRNEEHSPTTIRQYQRDILCFSRFWIPEN